MLVYATIRTLYVQFMHPYVQTVHFYILPVCTQIIPVSASHSAWRRLNEYRLGIIVGETWFGLYLVWIRHPQTGRNRKEHYHRFLTSKISRHAYTTERHYAKNFIMNSAITPPFFQKVTSPFLKNSEMPNFGKTYWVAGSWKISVEIVQ